MAASSNILLKWLLPLWSRGIKDLLFVDALEVNEHRDDTITGKILFIPDIVDTGCYSNYNTDCNYAGATILPRPCLRRPPNVREIVGSGATGLVGMTSERTVLKFPRPHEKCREDVLLERKIYRVLGKHDRVVTRYWDSEDGICLEYMHHGSLRDYMLRDNVFISEEIKFRWIVQATEAVEFIHSRLVVHADISPRNFLLDRDLNLKICDFGGASLEGMPASAIETPRYRLPLRNRSLGQPASIKSDIFALGSVIYEVETGSPPFSDLSSEDVQENYMAGVFPDTSGLVCGNIVKSCWQCRFQGCGEMLQALRLIAW
ncbi:kinase-like domain-containing protein [Lipomyces tetrasporus]|uniref:non-specific serine/threonine protein kinase n=1 Tax=Lipomyces tetrasporus TaxID=54092 RepID=A0AAD7QX85_9ASCO|nr:kinase-like domain-containing protein [Lipomyces tetrasporus]KAJ8103167.1 kinase-like domain-containing protein [Lipomyces tetrasporus]